MYETTGLTSVNAVTRAEMLYRTNRIRDGVAGSRPGRTRQRRRRRSDVTESVR